MRRLRLLQRLLERQLFHIYGGRFEHAGLLQSPIEAIVATLEDTPPEGDPAQLQNLRDRCLELNETVALRFEEKATDIGATARHIALERAIRRVTEAPDAPQAKTVDKTPNK